MSELFCCINCYLLVRLRSMNLCQILFSANQKFSALRNIALHRFINCCLFLCMFRFGFHTKQISQWVLSSTYTVQWPHARQKMHCMNSHLQRVMMISDFFFFSFPNFDDERQNREEQRKMNNLVNAKTCHNEKINKNKPSKCEWDGCFDWWMIWMVVCVWTVATHKIYRIMLQQEKKKNSYTPFKNEHRKLSVGGLYGVSVDFSLLQQHFRIHNSIEFFYVLNIIVYVVVITMMTYNMFAHRIVR